MQIDLKYARLLYDEALKLDRVEKTLDEVIVMYNALFNTPEVSKAVMSPVYLEQIKKIFVEISAKFKISKLVSNFMQLLIQSKSLNLLSNIINEYKNIIENNNGLMPVSLVSTKELDKASKIAVTKLLNEQFGKNIIINYGIDPELIGGIKATQGSLVFDASVKGAIDKVLIS